MVTPTPMESGKPGSVCSIAPFLDVRPLPDINQFVVTPQNGTEPDTDITTEPHAANDVGAGAIQI